MTTYDILPDTTRVWIYQAQAPLPTEKIAEIRRHLTQFVTSWVSHNNQLRAFGDIYHNQFIVLMVDESQAGASGCSIDKSVRFLQQIEQHYNVNLFDRMTFTYKEGETVKSANRMEFKALYEAGSINDQTLVFDNLVKNKGEFDKQWVKPLGESWHKRMV
ncbi:MAG: hypothetical protein AAF960_11095 [Bacteroidota bacterium]